jgi:type III restriction enzyme
LRLPVDEYGNRISNEEFLLNYIVDFTEADFANRLVAEINAELPDEQATHITTEEMERVATLKGITSKALFMELLTKDFIDIERKISIESINDFYQEYPEFNLPRLSGSKIIDKNKQGKNTIKIREARFNELKELWAAINKKYILYFNKEVETSIETALHTLLMDGVFGLQEITTDRQKIQAGDSQMEVLKEAGVTYLVRGRKLPYHVFLKRINKSTSIPITLLHKSILEYSKTDKEFKQEYFNESSVARFISKFNDWKYEHLNGRFNYKQTEYTPSSTKLTNADGSVKTEVVQGEIGINLLKGQPSSKYLYDMIAYDSPLECKNITEDIDEIVVYGKIPRRSISIPTIGNDSYSPDFMYVVKKDNGEKELNIVVETKQVEGKTSLRGEEEMKINCAKELFDQLSIDGYKVSYRTQLNNSGMKSIIEDICRIS